jgi:hypothetical protein
MQLRNEPTEVFDKSHFTATGRPLVVNSLLGINSRELTRVVIVTLGGRNFVDALAVVVRPSGTPRGI